jgi:phenylalanyl-tRNA synthetase beta chain
VKLPESWLRAYANPPIDSAALAERLTMSGLEVEELAPVAPPFSKVVVAHVKAVARHPNADKLTVCDVDAGTAATLKIVCGAPNVAAGMRVPCALPGAELPGGLQIRATTMRGVESQGMLCSARELGLSDDHSGLLALPAEAPVGADVREVLALDDQALTIKLTPNRGDCLSVIGVAREIAAITGAKLAAPAFEPVPATTDERLPVKILAPDLCGRFSGRVIRGLDARAQTPGWMKQRLERSGQRPISALVDISNYVMLELGRPSHVFDLDRVDGGLEVRWGRAGETLELLNGQTVELDGGVGVIADRRGVESLAGIMGGESTAVTLNTTNVYVEAAFWWPESIQGRSRRFNFATDAGHRFERGVDYATTVEHIDYITRLIVDVCGTPDTRVGPVDDQVTRLPERTPVRLRAARCRRVLGVDIGTGDMVRALERLGLPCRRDGSGADEAIVVTPPSYRFDLTIEEDLIEEVARLWGFDRIPAVPPRAAAAMRGRPEAVRSAHELRHTLAAAGYQELVNFSFVDEQWERDFGREGAGAEPIRVVNPIASQMSVMRTTLIGGLVAALRYNLNRKVARVRVFELGRVFRRDASVADGPLSVAGVAQPNRVAGLAYGAAVDEQWGVPRRDVDFHDVKGDVERLLAGADARFVAAVHPALHPGRSARIDAGGRPVGWIGELHPRWMQKYELPRAPVLFELDAEPLMAVRLPSVAPVPRFQPVLRDIAVWVSSDLPVQRVFDAVRELARSDERLRTLREFRLFDLYRPGGADSSKVAEAGDNALLNKDKSLAFRVVLQDTDRTLSDADADAAVAAISEGLKARLGARLRE